MISYLLIIWDLIKSRRILATNDISSAFTSAIVNRYLSMKDYRYYCLFKKINSNSKGIDNYAFFIFFTLKGWKRLLLAEAPRQVINIVTLLALVPQWLHIRNGQVTFNNNALGDDLMQQILTGTMAFSVLVFTVSFSLVCIATVLYIPLFCHIRGNLKEYCCHKVDKRISDILRKQDQRCKKRRIHPETELLMNGKSDEQPLIPPVNHASSPALSSVDYYEKFPYFKNNESPSISSSIPSGNPPYLLENNREKGNFNHQKSPGNSYKQAMQQLPYESSSYQYYTRMNDTSPKYTANTSTPSSTCINEHRYQHKKYPRGY